MGPLRRVRVTRPQPVEIAILVVHLLWTALILFSPELAPRAEVVPLWIALEIAQAGPILTARRHPVAAAAACGALMAVQLGVVGTFSLWPWVLVAFTLVRVRVPRAVAVQVAVLVVVTASGGARAVVEGIGGTEIVEYLGPFLDSWGRTR
jgi:hypothetical protein